MLHCRPMDSRIIEGLELFYSEVCQILVDFARGMSNVVISSLHTSYKQCTVEAMYSGHCVRQTQP